MINKLYENTKKYIKGNYKYLLCLITFFFLFTFKLPYYIEAPGGLINTKDKIEISSNLNMEGSLNLAYVTQIKGTLPMLAYAKLNKNWTIEKENTKTTGHETVEDAEYRSEMSLEESNDVSTLVALKYSNKTYKIENEKIFITYVDDIADTDLKVRDRIVKFNGITVTSKIQLDNLLSRNKAGDKIMLTVINDNKEYTRYAKLLKINGKPKIGIIIASTFDIKSDYNVGFKFKRKETGSSGGLMMTLTLYSHINNVDLTNGKKIVGTGTIVEDGSVGEIGGIEYKIKGAAKNKADIFLVPSKNYEEALKVVKKNKYKFKLVKINTFEEALKYLERG